jgi:mRNA-degrading endonuclease RelE of RelBE toxin-antitoxin system
MSFAVLFSPQAQHFLDTLQKDIALRITGKLGEVAEAPFRFLEHFEGGDDYKLRIGDYRALIDVDFPTQILKVRVLDKRGRIYKR